MRRLLLAVGLLLVAAPAAQAGGWATVGLSSTPEGTAPGEPWVVDLRIMQHGMTPLEGVKPKLSIVQGSTTKTFAARPTGRPGVYRAEVVFPRAGRWTFTVNDGFISQQQHTFPAVTIGAAAASAAGGPDLRWLVPGVALLVAAAALLLVRPRARRHHEPQAA